MSDNSHRDRADAARSEAAETNLPNVRKGNLRSAEAYEAMAAREETSAAKLKVRQDATAARRAAAVNADDDEDDDGKETDE